MYIMTPVFKVSQKALYRAGVLCLVCMASDYILLLRLFSAVHTLSATAAHMARKAESGRTERR